MALKILKVIWFCSLMSCTGIFMYVYASLPENVVVNESLQSITLSKETTFYALLGVIAFANAMVFFVSRVFPEKDEDFKGWFYGLIACTNLFFLIAVSFISLYNSGEKYDFERLGVIIYGSIVLVVLWAMAWPVIRIAQKTFNKRAV